MRCHGITLKNRQCMNTSNEQYCHLHRSIEVKTPSNPLIPDQSGFKKRSNPNCYNEKCVCLIKVETFDVSLGCGHIMHEHCILKLERQICPYCRFDFVDSLECFSLVKKLFKRAREELIDAKRENENLQEALVKYGKLRTTHGRGRR